MDPLKNFQVVLRFVFRLILNIDYSDNNEKFPIFDSPSEHPLLFTSIYNKNLYIIKCSLCNATLNGYEIVYVTSNCLFL